LLSGKVNIVDGLMNIPFGSNSTEQEAELLAGIELPFDLDLAIGADRDIWLRNSDTDLELSANMRVEYGRGLLNLSGELDTVRGVYHFVGRDFNIEEGKLKFLGTPTFDPELDVTGYTEIRESANQNTFLPVYITLSGTLSRPEITLSMPSHSEMTQNKLLLLLAMNISYDEFNSMDSGSGLSTSDSTSSDSNLATIISAQGSQYLTSYLSGQLGGVVRRWTSLDTVSVQSQTYYDNNTSAVEPQQMYLVTLGKYLNRDLYLSYTQQTPNYQNYQKMDLEYNLGSGFSILGTVGERSREKNLALSLKYLYRY
jgi:autotransporter translocation and assembly factor TamB